MSDDHGMTSGEIERVFGALGRIEQKIDSHTEWMNKHVQENKLVEEDVKKLQMSAAKQRGVLAALTAVGSIFGAVAGYAIDIIKNGHH